LFNSISIAQRLPPLKYRKIMKLDSNEYRSS
jgi:hypothetical protein